MDYVRTVPKGLVTEALKTLGATLYSRKQGVEEYKIDGKTVTTYPTVTPKFRDSITIRYPKELESKMFTAFTSVHK